MVIGVPIIPILPLRVDLIAALEPGKITPRTGISSFSLTSFQATAVAVLQAKTIILTFLVNKKLTNSQVYSLICSAGLGP